MKETKFRCRRLIGGCQELGWSEATTAEEQHGNFPGGSGAVPHPDPVVITQSLTSDNISKDHAHHRKCVWELVKSQEGS